MKNEFISRKDASLITTTDEKGEPTCAHAINPPRSTFMLSSADRNKSAKLGWCCRASSNRHTRTCVRALRVPAVQGAVTAGNTQGHAAHTRFVCASRRVSEWAKRSQQAFVWRCTAIMLRRYGCGRSCRSFSLCPKARVTQEPRRSTWNMQYVKIFDVVVVRTRQS